MQTLKTENCIICGQKADWWHGYVLGKDKRALGYTPVKIIAGFCDKHQETENETGNYGNYEPDKHGKCMSLFQKVLDSSGRIERFTTS